MQTRLCVMYLLLLVGVLMIVGLMIFSTQLLTSTTTTTTAVAATSETTNIELKDRYIKQKLEPNKTEEEIVVEKKENNMIKEDI